MFDGVWLRQRRQQRLCRVSAAERVNNNVGLLEETLVRSSRGHQVSTAPYVQWLSVGRQLFTAAEAETSTGLETNVCRRVSMCLS